MNKELTLAKIFIGYFAQLGIYDTVLANYALVDNKNLADFMPALLTSFLEVNIDDPNNDDINFVINLLLLGGFNNKLIDDGKIGDELRTAIDNYLTACTTKPLPQYYTEIFKKEDETICGRGGF